MKKFISDGTRQRQTANEITFAALAASAFTFGQKMRQVNARHAVCNLFGRESRGHADLELGVRVRPRLHSG